MTSYGPEIWIAKDENELAQEATKRILEAMKKTLTKQDRFSLVLSGGKTPRLLYQMLGSHKELDWTRVDFFFGDERVVPKNSPDSNYLLAKQTLFDPLNIQSNQIYDIPTETSPTEAASQYHGKIHKFFAKNTAGFDAVLLGLGHDGHTASLFPGNQALVDPSKPTPLCIAVEAPKPPSQRVSLTPFALNQAKQAFILVSGKEKAAAVSAALESDSEPSEIPVRAIDPSGRLVWLIDRAAACALTHASG